MPNIQFNYLYRDAGNYKSYGSLIFANKEKLSLEFIQEQVTNHLIDGDYFLPQKWQVPFIYKHPYDPELDHDWYEVESVEYTEEAITEEKDIKDFLALLQ